MVYEIFTPFPIARLAVMLFARTAPLPGSTSIWPAGLRCEVLTLVPICLRPEGEFWGERAQSGRVAPKGWPKNGRFRAGL